MIARLALLGAVKHWKRSLVVVGAAAVACAVMIAVGSLLGGITASFYDSVVPNSGHVRINDARAASALSPLGLDLLLPQAAAQAQRIKDLKDPRIVDVETLLPFAGLLVEDSSLGEPRNLPMRGIGLDPDTRFADNVRQSIIAGAFLPGGEGIALSDRAARLVGSGLGKTVLLLVQDASGQPWYESVRVTGIFHTESSDFDETTFYIGQASASRILDVEGRSREIRILLSDRRDAEAVAGEIRAVLGDGAGSPLKVETWQSINASVFTLLLFVSILLYIIMGLFAVVAGTIIANTSLVSVMERLREFGTMRAIGLRASSLERLILLEGVMLGAAGALLGMALGSAVVALLSKGGLDLGGAMESLGLRRYNRPRVDFLWYLACAGMSLFVSVLASLKAARAVARKGVAESLATAA